MDFIPDPRLMCEVRSLAYKFGVHAGEVYLREGHHSDMTGCVHIFYGIDPYVSVISVYSGAKLVVTYYRMSKTTWRATVDDRAYQECCIPPEKQ